MISLIGTKKTTYEQKNTTQMCSFARIAQDARVAD